METSNHKPISGRSRIGLEPGYAVGNGRYRIKKLIGHGRISEVWTAFDNRLREFVALKFFLPEFLTNAEILEILRREIIKNRKLAHPNIIRIYDLHETGKEPPFIEMELVDGPNLLQLCHSKPRGVLTWYEVSPLLKQLISAIQYAHSENIIHRNIKPSNLLINSQGTLKVGDFGIERVANGLLRVGGYGHLPGGISGYYSPQQLAGEPASYEDDVYGIGALLYTLITGTPPFYEDNLEYQIYHTKPEPLKERLLKLGVENLIPPTLEDFIQSCIEKNASKRPSDWKTIIEKLENIDREFNDLKSKEISSVTEIKNNEKIIEDSSIDGHSGKLKSSMPFIIAFIFCIALLILSLCIKKTPAKVNISANFQKAQQITTTNVSTIQNKIKNIIDSEKKGSELGKIIRQNDLRGTQTTNRNNIVGQTKIARGKVIADLSIPLTALVKSEEDSWIIVSDATGWTRMVNGKSGSVVWEKNILRSSIKAMMMSDNRRFIAGGSEGKIVVCSIFGGEKMTEIDAHNDEIVSIATSHGRYFATLDINGVIKVWDSTSFRFITQIKSMLPTASRLALSPDGKMLVAGKQNGVVNIYSLPSGEIQKSFIGHKTDISQLWFDPLNYSLYTVGKEDRTIKCWDLISMSETKQLKAQTPLREVFLFARLSSKLSIGVIVSDANYGYIIDTKSFDLKRKIKFDIHTRPVSGVEFLSDSSIITIGLDGFICVWEI